MPINEASGLPLRSHLTREQKRKAEAVLLGLPNDDTNMDLNELTPQEIERMREIVLQHDRTSNRIKEFDLNNPPQGPQPYAPYPKMIYHHGQRIYKVIQNEEQLEEHLAQGWNTKPYPMDEAAAVPQLTGAAAAEAAEVNERLAQLRRQNPKK